MKRLSIWLHGKAVVAEWNDEPRLAAMWGWFADLLDAMCDEKGG